MSAAPPSSTHVNADPQTLDLRSQIVNVLSNTANNCLKELGYHPGLISRLNDAEQLNARLNSDLKRLYEDNAQLLNSLKVHEQNAQFLQAPEAAKLKQIHELTQKNLHLSEQSKSYVKDHGAVVSAYQRLLADYNHLGGMHRSALNEISLLRSQCADLQKGHTKAKNGQSSQAQQPQAPSHGQTINMQAHRRVSSVMIPPSAVVGQSMLRPIPSPSTPVFPGGPPTFSPSVHPVRHGNMGSWVQGRNYAPPFPPYYRMPSNSPQVSPTDPHAPSHAIPPRRASFSSNTPQVSPTDLHTDSHAMHNMLPTPNPTPTAPAHSFIYHQQQQQHPSAPFFYRSAPTPVVPQSQSTSLAAALVPAVVPFRHPVSRRKSETPPTPAMTAGSCSSPLEMAEALTPASDMGASTGAATIASHPDVIGKGDEPQSSRKRSSVQMLEGCGSLVNDDAKKKVKLEVDCELHVSPADVKPDAKVGLAVDKEDSEDEVIEVDADGLVPVEHCVAEIMVEDETDNGIVSCHMCNVRFQKGLIPGPPKPFVNPTEEQLVAHCTTEHPAAWDLLRKRVQ